MRLTALLLTLSLLSCAQLAQVVAECGTPAMVRAAEGLAPQAADALRQPNWGGALDALLRELGPAIVCAVRRLSVIGESRGPAEPLTFGRQPDPVPGRAREWLRTRGYEVRR